MASTSDRGERFRLEHHELTGGRVTVNRVVKVQRFTRVSLIPAVHQQQHLTTWQLTTSTLIISLPPPHTHTRLTALSPGLPRWASTRKVKPNWILLKQETVSGSGISWAICKSAHCSRQITTPAPHQSVFYGPNAVPAAKPTVSKHWSYNNSTIQ